MAKTCQMPGCDDEPDGKFCSDYHELKYEHIKSDAEDARRAEVREATPDRDLPERDGPPY